MKHETLRKEVMADIWLTADNLPPGVLRLKRGKDEWKETVSAEKEQALPTAPLPPHNRDHPHSSTSRFTQPGNQGARDEITPSG